MRHRRRGGNAIEFALIAPVLFAILTGTMEYGWFMMNQILLDSACREGARTGARTDPDTGADPHAAAIARAAEYWTALGVPGTPTFVSTPVIAAGHTMLVVEGTLPYPGLVGMLAPTPPEVKAHVVTRSETEN